MDTKPPTAPSNSFLLAAWEKHEKIAMHFNELILKIRTQALGALAAVVTIGGVLLRTDINSNNLPWGLLACIFGILLVFWVAIWVLDLGYYNRLLLGAVDSLLALEEAINAGAGIQFAMSHKIEHEAKGGRPTHRSKNIGWAIWFFYCAVAAILLLGTVYSATVHIRHQHRNTHATEETPLTYLATPGDPPPHRLVSPYRGDNKTQKPNTCPDMELA